MKPIFKRLCRLEEQRGIGNPDAIEHMQRLIEGLEAGRRRVAEARARGEYHQMTDGDDREYPPGLTRVEILHLGRERARERSIQVWAARSLAPAGGRP
jgi:hypothetical protein